MSTQIKLILPLLDENLSKEDFTEEHGFVNAYTYDKNRPNLLSHLFLLYKSGERTYPHALTIEKLNNLKCLYSWKTIRIGGVYYILFILILTTPKLKSLLQGIPSFTMEDITKTLKFWDLKEDDVNRILFGENPLLRADNTSVPEEDYSLPDITKSNE